MTEPDDAANKLDEDFKACVLFSRPQQMHAPEIYEALEQRFPDLDWTCEPSGPPLIDTTGVTMFTDACTDGGTRGHVLISGTPGPVERDWHTEIARAGGLFENAAAEIARHTDHLTITVASGGEDHNLTDRLDAARRMTCIAAIFAAMPGARAVWYPAADLVVSPADWVRAADEAVAGRVPVFCWVSTASKSVPDGTMAPPVTVQSVGMAAFNGMEVLMPKSRLPERDSGAWVMGTVGMILEDGHVFEDGHTMGLENSEEKIVIRRLRAGMHGAKLDMWVLLHPRATVTEEQMFGSSAAGSAAMAHLADLEAEPAPRKRGLWGLFSRKKG